MKGAYSGGSGVSWKKGRCYLGFIKINESRIWLEIYCTGCVKEQE